MSEAALDTKFPQRKRKSEEKSTSEASNKRSQKAKEDNQGSITNYFPTEAKKDHHGEGPAAMEEPPEMEPLLSQSWEYDNARTDGETCPLTNKDARTKTLQDRIYGQMDFHPLLTQIMDTPEFQRLGSLKQLGVSDLVYRTATHTRFEHSCGVVFLAGKIMDQFDMQRKKDKILRRSNFRCSEWWKGNAGAESSLCRDQNGKVKTIIAKITEADRLCVLIAALVHDLGHGPYSHMFEHVVKNMASEKEQRWTHEQMSVKMLRHLLEKNNIDISAHGLDKGLDLLFIEELIMGDDLEGGVAARKGRGKDKEFLYDIVNNAHSGLDVDKLDYFMRDTKAALGQDNKIPLRFVELARVAWVPTHPEPGSAGGERGGRWEVCWPTKMAPEAPKLFNIRYNMHSQVYQHRKVKCFEHIVTQILCLALQEPLICVVDDDGENERRYTIEEAVWEPEAFLHLTDDILSAVFHAPGPFRDAAKMREAKRLYQKLKRRNIWRFVGCTSVELPDGVNPEEYAERAKQDIVSHAEEEAEMVIPETPQEEEEDGDDVRLSQRETPLKKKPSKASEGAAGGEQELTTEDLLVEVVSIHHGKKSHDPVARMNFFVKTAEETGRWVAQQVPPTVYESQMPFKLQSHELRVLVRDDDKLEAAIKCHKAWCQANNLPEPISMLSQDVDDESMSSMAG